MASSASIPSFRRRRLPSPADFPAPVNLTHDGLIQTLLSFAREIVSSSHCKKMAFQRKNSRSLTRKIDLFVILLESLDASVLGYSHKSHLCFEELHLILYRSKILLDYCFQSSKLWLILQNVAISGHYNDLSREISTLLDVFPVEDLKLEEDLKEQIKLMQKQLRRSNSLVSKEDEALRRKLYSFLDDFENAGPPDDSELRSFFIDHLKIQDSKSFREEIEFLEKELRNHEDQQIRPSASMISGFIALARYSRFMLFGFGGNHGMIFEKIGDNFLSVPKDFCCPITLELMTDPVIISTGQTYDRSSVKRWMDEGHQTCPKTGQTLTHTRLVPNHALKNLIVRCCEPTGSSSRVSSSKAAFGANKAIMALLIQQLARGSEDSKGMVAREMRLMARESKEIRIHMAEAGAIPYLRNLLVSPDAAAQENSVTALLNMSIHGKNKSRIIEEEGCLRLIVKVLESGMTAAARENAAAVLFSPSTVHSHRARIGEEEGSIEALTSLLREGTTTARGKKDAVAALLNLSTRAENVTRMVESTAVAELVKALRDEEVWEEAAGAIAMIVRRSEGVEGVLREGWGVRGLVGVMRGGSPKGKENAVAALLEMCRSGGGRERVAEVAAVGGALRGLVFGGTKRARRKAASLARVFRSGLNKDSGEVALVAVENH